jgi:hypothetical protein
MAGIAVMFNITMDLLAESGRPIPLSVSLRWDKPHNEDPQNCAPTVGTLADPQGATLPEPIAAGWGPCVRHKGGCDCY